MEIEREMQIRPHGSRDSQWDVLKSVPTPQQLDRPIVWVCVWCFFVCVCYLIILFSTVTGDHDILVFLELPSMIKLFTGDLIPLLLLV